MSSLPASITLSHGAGGRDTARLLEDVILPRLTAADRHSGDSASLPRPDAGHIAFTTDSYTITPREFPGGDIGSLAVNGTVNDLAVAGARPLYLSCALIIEEGFDTGELCRILDSMAAAASAAGVTIVTGDTKVVHRGAIDGLFITTSGIGALQADLPGPEAIQCGDLLLVSGPVGDHGAAILAARGDLNLDVPVSSDCRPLHHLCAELTAKIDGLRCLRDATRGGLVAVANEFSLAAGRELRLEEKTIPVRPPVRGACEILGLDPLYFANEGTLLAVVTAAQADRALAILRENPYGEAAAVIGEFTETAQSRVVLRTPFGSERVLDLPVGELLPRIC